MSVKSTASDSGWRIAQTKNGEKLQQIFAPFRFPLDLTIKTAGCDAEANAWYERPAMKPSVTICYEYIDEDIKIPKETTAAGITPPMPSSANFFTLQPTK